MGSSQGVPSVDEWMGNSLMVQSLGLHTFTAKAQVRSLVEELRAYKLFGVAKKKKKKRRINKQWYLHIN